MLKIVQLTYEVFADTFDFGGADVLQLLTGWYCAPLDLRLEPRCDLHALH